MGRLLNVVVEGLTTHSTMYRDCIVHMEKTMVNSYRYSSHYFDCVPAHMWGPINHFQCDQYIHVGVLCTYLVLSMKTTYVYMYCFW